MKKCILSAFVFVFCITCSALADRALSRDEVLQIFQQLTNQPRKTWIPAGTIEATRIEYKAPKITNESELSARINQKVTEYANSTNKRELTEELQTLAADALPFNVRYELANESTTDSQVIVKYDGNKFYWEINVTSRNDSVRPDMNLRANYMTNHFNLMGNARRIFVWDGEKYTAYRLPINQATVDTTNSTPHVVNGPLTAGIIPWGYGVYSYDNLAAVPTSAVETTVDNQTQIQLTVNRPNGNEIVLTLDPAKNYEVISCITSRQDGSVTLQQYSNYSQVGANWVPGTISLEKYEANTNRLLSRDRWDITSINAEVPAADAFKIDFKPAASIQYSNPARAAICRQTDKNKVNCATVALKRAAAKFGKNLSDEKLTSLVSKSDNMTNFSAMKKFIDNSGLYCTAVEADIETLKNFKDCQVIVHLTGKNHFVALDELNNDTISADLQKCAALLISDKPFGKQFAAISDDRLTGIIGAAYTCTKVIQQAGDDAMCSLPSDGDCEGSYTVHYTVLGCQFATSGTCANGYWPRNASCPCVYNSEIEDCQANYEWTYTYVRACNSY